MLYVTSATSQIFKLKQSPSNGKHYQNTKGSTWYCPLIGLPDMHLHNFFFFKIYVGIFFINQNISEIEAECQSFYESSCLVTGTNSYKRDILFTFLKILLIKFLT